MAFKLSILKNYWAALIWAAFILFLCGVPGNQIPPIDFWAINIEDKIAHVGIFAILGVLMVYGNVKKNGFDSLTTKRLMGFSIIGLAYGFLTEALQHFVFIDRFASFGDFIADGIGSVCGTVFAFWFYKYKNQTPR